VWSADGKQLIVASSRGTSLGLFRVASDGRSQPEQLLAEEGFLGHSDRTAKASTSPYRTRTRPSPLAGECQSFSRVPDGDGLWWTAVVKRTRNSRTDLKARLETFDLAGLVGLIADLYEGESGQIVESSLTSVPRHGAIEEYRRGRSSALFQGTSVGETATSSMMF
jgi:hypothetical protein